jgi:ribonuclease HII
LRAAVRGAAAPASPTVVELFAEVYRLRLLTGVEDLLRQYGYLALAGVDEAGRGALAGPVVAAAVVVDPRRLVPGVDDSKQLSAAERERLARAVRETALAFSVAAVAPDIIDRINILEATRRAMRQALMGLRPRPDCAVVDAVALRGLPFPSLPLIRGDSVSYAVASASILAKVERDRLMAELDRDYPHYGFAEHKGYGVPVHLAALQTFGPSPVHRLTYRPVLPRRERREVAC